jgi:hypothetical protein
METSVKREPGAQDVVRARMRVRRILTVKCGEMIYRFEGYTVAALLSVRHD